MQQFIRYPEARRLVLEAMSVVESEEISLFEAAGRVLAEPVVSRVAVPPFDNAAMDGYAVRLSELPPAPLTLRVSGQVAAGKQPTGPLVSGTCVQIMTGAPVPEGTEAVVPVEWTEMVSETEVRIDRLPEPMKNVRRAGKDVEPGQTVCAAGSLITPAIAGLIASVGQDKIVVRRRPTLAIISTGDELAAPGTTLRKGQIFNSNGVTLAAQARAAGAEVTSVATAADNPDELKNFIKQAADADAIVLSGGVSMGVHDYVQDVLRGLDVELLFWKVRQRPGKPLLVGKRSRQLVFGLPGNPVSSSICFDQYVRPALAGMMGRPTDRPRYLALLQESMTKAAGLHHFARGIAATEDDAVLRVRPTGSQDSNLLGPLARANCLIHLTERMENPPEGTMVEIEWLEW